MMYGNEVLSCTQNFID